MKTEFFKCGSDVTAHEPSFVILFTLVAPSGEVEYLHLPHCVKQTWQ